MHPIEMVIYLRQSLLSQHGTQRFWFCVCVVFIALGLLAIVGNLMEPSKASF
jgi:hypothetical protein